MTEWPLFWDTGQRLSHKFSSELLFHSDYLHYSIFHNMNRLTISQIIELIWKFHINIQTSNFVFQYNFPWEHALIDKKALFFFQNGYFSPFLARSMKLFFLYCSLSYVQFKKRTSVKIGILPTPPIVMGLQEFSSLFTWIYH